MSVVLDQVTVRIDQRIVLDRIDLTAPIGQVTGLIGPNGSGKSTLLRTVFRSRRPESGTVTVLGNEVWSMSAREAAKAVAVVLQDLEHAIGASVEDVVGLGRTPYRGDRRARQDRAIVTDALSRTGTAGLRHRMVDSLSGGQRQRVQLARALAQTAPVLLLDEPTNHLDISARAELLELLDGLHGTTVAALHDLDLAAAYCDHLVVLKAGRVVASGPPDHVLTPALIAAVYGVQAEIGINPLTDRPTVHLGTRLGPSD